MSLSVQTIFSGSISLQTTLFMFANNLHVLFLLLQTGFSGFFIPTPKKTLGPPLSTKSVRSHEKRQQISG